MQANGANIVSRFWEYVFNDGDLELMDSLLASNYRLHDLSTNLSHTRVQLKSILLDVQHQLPDTYVRIDEQFEAEGDRVVTRLTFRSPDRRNYQATTESTDEGSDPAQDMAPPQEWHEYSGVSICRVSNQQIVETRIIWEAMRAEMELEPADTNWRWPPWR